MRVALVYQHGLANVFAVDRFDWDDPEERHAVRIVQHSSKTCFTVACALGAGGMIVRTATCDALGDCAKLPWLPGIGDSNRPERVEVSIGNDDEDEFESDEFDDEEDQG